MSVAISAWIARSISLRAIAQDVGERVGGKTRWIGQLGDGSP
jgi:hypothetical protein